MKKIAKSILLILPFALLLGLTMVGMKLGNDVIKQTQEVIDYSPPPVEEKTFIHHTTYHTEYVGDAEIVIPETEKIPLPNLRRPEEK